MITALVPLLAALAALAATFALDVTIPSLETAISRPEIIFGFFARQWPFIGFIAVYAIARLLMVAFTAQRPFILARLLLWLPATFIMLALLLYPTVGGIIARAGFAPGGMALMNDVPPLAAQAAGGAMGGLVLALVLGLGHAIISWNWRPTLARTVRGLASALALMLGGVILALGWPIAAATGSWPMTPMGGAMLLTGAVVLALALLPHVLVSAWSARAARRLERAVF